MSAPGMEEIEGLARSGPRGRAAHHLMRIRRRLGFVRPFDVEVPTPARRDPVELHGELWAVTAYFNPSGAPIQLDNYRRFRSRLAAQGVPLLAVELGFGDRPFDLAPEDADQRVQVRGGDVLWQKERLLNLGIQALPAECDRVAWLDCDVLFDRDDWASETARLLCRYRVVQPFLRRVRLAQDQTWADPRQLSVGMGENQVHYGIAFGVAAKGRGALSSYRRHGSTGFAWAARRSLLEAHGLYDRLVLGGADKAMARAMYAGGAGVFGRGFSPALTRHLRAWADRLHADVDGSVGYTDATVLHLWHGSGRSRGYADRDAGLVEHAYDPATDVASLPGEALAWSGRNPGLETWVSEYFAGRGKAAGEAGQSSVSSSGSTPGNTGTPSSRSPAR